MRTVKHFTKNGSLCEIYSTGFQLAFVSPDLEQTHQWVLCKDFMTDVIWATIHNQMVGIYGFQYNPKTFPAMSCDPVMLVARNKTKADSAFDKEVQLSCEFIHFIEAKLGFEATTVEKVEHGDKGSVWMFTCDKRWIHSSALFSMLTLFLRVGCYYKGNGKMNEAVAEFKKVNHNDARYLKQSRALRNLIIKRGMAIFASKMEDNYPKSATIHTIHDRWGIVNSAKCQTFTAGLWDLKGLDTIVKKKDDATTQLAAQAEGVAVVVATKPLKKTKSKAKKKAIKKKVAKKLGKKVAKKKAKKKASKK